MKKKLFYILFVGGFLFQIIVALKYILPLAPQPNQWGFIDEEFYTIVYILIGLISISIKYFKRLPYNWLVVLCSIVVLYFTAQTLIIHSPYYYNQGELPFFINTYNKMSIIYYNELNKFPPKINICYALIIYNIIILILIIFPTLAFSKKIKSIT